jgi:hypothetical protein
MADDSGKQYRDNLEQSQKFARNLKEEFLALDGISDSTKKKMGSIADSLKMQSDISGQLTTLIQERNTFIEEALKNNDDISDKALEILDTEIQLLEKKKEQVDLQNQLKDIGKDFVKDLANSVGISNELADALMKASKAAIVLVILKEVASFLLDSFNNARKFSKELGVSAMNAAGMEANIQLARLELIGLGYDADEVRQSMSDIVEATGMISVPPKTLADVTKLTSLLGDSNTAVSLQRTLKNAGVDAGALTDSVTEMANKLGMDAGPAMEYLASNQLELGGLTEQQILKRAEEGLMLKKMGADMKELNRLASESLDIETSLRNEMKLRMMTGKEINLNELRAAQASGDVVALGKAQANLVAQLGDDLHNNLQVQRMISDATGMSTEQLLNYDNASKENAKTQDELLAIKEKYGLADIDQAKTLQLQQASMKDMLTTSGMVVGGLVAMVGLMQVLSPLMKKMLPGGDSKKGNPISNFIKSMGSKQVLMGAAAMLIISASLMVTAKALNEFNTVEWESLGMAGLALLGLVGSVAALGAVMMSGIGAVAILAGAAALLTIAGSMVVLGAGIQLIGNNIGSLENLVPMLSSLVLLSPGLLALSGSLTILSGSLLGLSVGLAAVSVFLPVLGALSNIGLIGGGGETQETDNGMGELLDEVKGLRRDIQTQPIMINVDGKVVSAISKVQSRQMSVNTTGYGR